MGDCLVGHVFPTRMRKRLEPLLLYCRHQCLSSLHSLIFNVFPVRRQNIFCCCTALDVYFILMILCWI